MIRISFLILIVFFNTLYISSQENRTRGYTHSELLDLSVEDLLDLDVNVQVVATKGERLFNSSSTVTIINKQIIQDYNLQNIREALQIVAGFSVNDTYLKKDIPSSRGILQNHYANKVLILINGIPTFHSITGEGNISRIDIHDVERIEVLKGPASVLYGSNAYGGAVNIVLKTDKSEGIESHIGLGYKSLFSTGANTKVDKKDFNFFISGNSQTATPYESDFTDENGEKGIVTGTQNNQNITIHGNYKASSLLLNAYNNSEGFLGVTANFASGANNPHKLKGYMANYQFSKEITEKLNIKANAAIDWNLRSFARDRADSIRSDIRGYRLNSNLKFSFQLNKHILLDAGGLIDYRTSLSYTNYTNQTKEITSQNNLKNKSVVEQSYFAQANILTGRLTSTIGVRYTNNNSFGGNFSPRASFVYVINKNNSLKFIYGESFRAPSLFELYFLSPDSTIFGNMELSPEKLKSSEIAYLKSFKNLFFQVIAYYSIHENNIQRVTANVHYNNKIFPNQRIYVNGNKYQSYGIETEIKYNNPKILQAFLNYNFCTGNKGDTIGNNNHYNFKFVPTNQITIGITKPFKHNIFTSVLYHYWSEVSGVIEEIPSQHSLDFNIGYKQQYKNIGIIHTVSIRNILNTDFIVPEYVRGEINSIPSRNGLSIFYSAKINLN